MTQRHITKIKVLGTIRELPEPGVFCLYDKKDDVTDPLLNEEYTFRPLACFRTLREALDIDEDAVPTWQGMNSRGTPRRIHCESSYYIADDTNKNLGPLDRNKPPERPGRFGIAEVSGTGCFNRTFPDGAELWDYGPDEVEKYEAGKPSKVHDPEPLA
jgi:hypothetical protein